MRIWKRIAAGFLAGALLLGGCSSEDRSWAFRAGDNQPPIGIYILNMINSASDLEAELRELHADDADYKYPEKYSQLLKQDLDGTPMPDAIKAEAETRMRNYLAVETKFEEMGLTLSEEELANADSTAASSWSENQAYFEKNGIGEASLRLYLENSFKQQRIFQTLYTDGGEREVPAAEMQKALAEYYAMADVMIMQKQTGEEGEATRKEAEGYLTRAQAGENFYDLIFEQEKAAVAASRAKDPEVEVEDAVRPEDNSRTVIFNDSMRGQYSDELIDAALAATPGTPVLVEDQFFFYILNPKDINENPNALLTYYDDVLQRYKWEEFEELVTQWGTEVTLESNEAALSRYTPSWVNVDLQA